MKDNTRKLFLSSSSPFFLFFFPGIKNNISTVIIKCRRDKNHRDADKNHKVIMIHAYRRGLKNVGLLQQQLYAHLLIQIFYTKEFLNNHPGLCSSQSLPVVGLKNIIYRK